MIPDFDILISTAVSGYKRYRISVYLLATAVCGYKGYLITATAVSNSALALSINDGRSTLPLTSLRWLDTVFKNSGVQHFEMFKLRIFRIYSADIGVFIYFDNSTFKLY
jgi:hypothetical protein